MAGTPSFQITSAGLAAASIAMPQGPYIEITSFQIGSGYGYTPLATDTGIDGSLLFEGTPTSYQNVGNGTLDILCEIPPNAGPFQFGEVALMMPGNVMFAKAVFPTPQTKFSALGSNVVSSYELHCLLTLAQGTAIFQVSTTVPITLLQVYNWSDVYPPSLSANPGVPLLQVMEPSEFGDSTLLMNSNSSTWTIGSTYARYNQHNDTPSFPVANASTTWIEVLATELDILDLTAINERFVLETSDHYFRSVSSVVLSGPNYRFNLNGTPLQTVPALGSTITIYRDDLARGDSYYSQILDPLNYDITNFALDTGTTNAYAATYKQKSPVPQVGMIRSFQAANRNTGASTFALDGGSPYPIHGRGYTPLQGSEMQGACVLRFDASGAWIVMSSTDGPLPVPNAQFSQQALTLGQAQTDFAAINGSAMEPFAASEIMTPVVQNTAGPLLLESNQYVAAVNDADNAYVQLFALAASNPQAATILSQFYTNASPYGLIEIPTPSGIFKFQWVTGASDGNGNMIVPLPTAFTSGIYGGIADEANPLGWGAANCTVWAFNLTYSSATTAAAIVREVTGGSVYPAPGISGRILVWGI